MLAGGLLATCVVVPCLFTTRLDAVFAVPKLAALWAALAFGLAVVAIGVLHSGRLARGTRLLPIVDVAAASFLVLNVAAWGFSTDRRQSLYGERLQYQGLLTVVLYVGFFYLARLSLTDARRLRILVGAVALGGTLVSGYALAQRVGLDPIWGAYSPSRGVFSSIGQSNALAAYLVLVLSVSTALLFGTKAVARSALLLALAAMVAALALTSSRGGYLGVLVTLAVLAIGWQRNLGAGTRRASSLLAASLATGATIVALGQLARTYVGDDESVRFHLDAWRVAAQIAAEHPVLGTGQETFPDAFPRYSHAVLPPERAAPLDAFRVESPHNVYLGIAAGAGFPALVAYLGIVAGFAVALLRAARTATREVRVLLVAVLAAASGHLVTDAFMTAEVTGTWLFWVLMGAGLGLVSGLRLAPAASR